MEDFIRFIIKHRLVASVVVIVTILLAWLISFFMANSLLIVKVNSSQVSHGQTVDIQIDDKLITQVEVGKSSLIAFPRQSSYISAQTSQQATLAKLKVPLIINYLDLQLKSNNSTKLSDTSGNNCYHARLSTVFSWQCDELEFDVRITKYSDDSFPLQSSLDLSDQYLEYAQRYNNGFLALSNLDGIGVHYVDLSQSEPAITSLNLGPNFVYETSKVIIDSKNSNNFVVLDQNSLSYQFYKDSLGAPEKSGKLPSDFNIRSNSSSNLSLENGNLTYYVGRSSDNKDDHTQPSNQQADPGKVVSYNLDKSQLSKTTSTSELACSKVVIAGSNLACIDRSTVNIYQLNNLTVPQLSLTNSYDIFSHNDSLYVTQQSSVYKYDAASQALNSVFKIADRNIASSYIRNSTLYVSAWYTYPDERQRTLAYEVDLAKTASNPAILSAFPFDISDEITYGTDVRHKTIYISLVEDSEENRLIVRDKLEASGIKSDYQLVFDSPSF